MKKIIIAIILLVLGVVAIVFWLVERNTPTTQVPHPIQFPASGSTSAATTAENAFLGRPEIHQDPDNPGYYFFGYQQSDASAPYLIRYIAETHNFTIAITQEPIGVNRKKAEKYLMQLLGANEEQMCSLNYSVYVSNDVNTQYSGENLGFSFCPNAIQLPN